jgi:hypothetical protein
VSLPLWVCARFISWFRFVALAIVHYLDEGVHLCKELSIPKKCAFLYEHVQTSLHVQVLFRERNGIPPSCCGASCICLYIACTLFHTLIKRVRPLNLFK